jgi:hypothetical protein
MAELFANLHPDRGVTRGLWARRAVVTLFTVFSALALWGLFGQRASESTAAGPAARMVVSAPATVRGGDFYQATIDITATAALQHPRIVLAAGWLEGMQINSIEPAAVSESSRAGRVVLSYGQLKPGDRLKLWLQYQVDPTYPGKRSHAVELDEEDRPVARVDRNLTVLP